MGIEIEFARNTTLSLGGWSGFCIGLVRSRSLWIILFGFFVSLGMEARPQSLPSPSQREIDFIKEVQPIFAASCLHCHGPRRQEGDYRLDIREVALQGGVNHAPNILPNQSAESPLIKFVSWEVEGMHMPSQGKRLTDLQLGILKAWIDQGAQWPDSANGQIDEKGEWWSLVPLRTQSPPGRTHATHPIDAFIQAKLQEKNLHPSPPADRRVLIRRLYFNLIGLPPTPEEVESFATNSDPNAYELLVDQLLASPRYGERWARHWMDTAHFAETHGHDQDRIREHAWPYRDYLIKAFNDDKAYGQFVAEQIAADVLAVEDPSAIAALGFLAAGPWDESSLRDIREDTIDREIGRYLDRDDMLTNVMSNFTSLTVHCARCHDHKFDPIPQSDYYALQAVFAGVERANRAYDLDPAIASRRRDTQARLDALGQLSQETRNELLGSVVAKRVQDWELQQRERAALWQVLSDQVPTSLEGSQLTLQEDGSILASGPRPERDTYTLLGASSLTEITALRLEVMTDPSLPLQGPGRQENGNLHLSELEVSMEEVGSHVEQRIEIARATADFDQKGWDISKSIDGKPETAWGIHPQVSKPHEAIFEWKKPLQFTKDARLEISLKQLHGGGHTIGRFRLSVTSQRPPISHGRLPEEIASVLSLSVEKRTDEQRLQLALHVEQEKAKMELASLPKRTLTYAAAADFEPDGGLKPPKVPRTIHRLERGDIRNPKEESHAGSLVCISSIPSRFVIDDPQVEGMRRASLAKWIVHRDNPLTWRSIVNRTWLHHFGRGIVDTPNDFGRLGSEPTHPELLDWLAIHFRDSGQSLKSLHRLIVTSQTYQQSSRAKEIFLPATSSTSMEDGNRLQRDDRATEIDVDNRYLWRMHRNRLDAESVRDAMLIVSGELDLRMGGPSDRQFDLKPGRHVTPIIDYRQFDLSSSLAVRRSVYRFLFRTLPDPFMEALDCPAGDQIMPTRANSVTVQQSLAMWNDIVVLRLSERLAERLQATRSNTNDRIELAFQMVFGRAPKGVEQPKYVAYADQHGLANLCRLLFNANEFIFID